MFYITLSNYFKLINCLDLRFKEGIASQFYKSCKLKDFDLDLGFFSANEARKVVISERLYHDISSLMREMCFIPFKNNKDWVIKVAKPAYHTKLGCTAMRNDFFNVEFPTSLVSSCREEYRDFLMANWETRYKRGTPAPIVSAFCAELKTMFNLDESIQDLASLPVKYDNSGFREFCELLDKEEKIAEIKQIIGVFNAKANTFSKAEVARAVALLKDHQFTENLSEEKQIALEQLVEYKRQITSRILAFHFYHCFEQGLDLSKELLELAGMRICQCCGH